MGNRFLAIVLVSALALGAAPDDSEPGSVQYRSGETYLCRMGEGLIVELPDLGPYTIDLQGNDRWEAESSWNLVWVSPKAVDDKLQLIIRNRQGQRVVLSLRSVRTGESTAKKIVVSELGPPELDAEALQAAGKAIEPTPPPAVKPKESSTPLKAKEAEPSSEKDSQKDKKFQLESQFALNGGTYAINRETSLRLNGEATVAGKNSMGWFLQFSAMADLGGFQKRIGQSLGVGYENDKFGAFLFMDALEFKLGDYRYTVHYQARPALRIRTGRMHLTAFYAFPVSADQYTGVDDSEDFSLGVYNYAVSHFGFDIQTLLTNRLLFHAFGRFGGASVYRMGAGFEFCVWKNLRLVGSFYSTNYGNYPLLMDEDYGNAVEFQAGLRLGLGRVLEFKEMKSKIVFPVDYPIITNVKKKKEGKDADHSLRIALEAEPVCGYAPLPVTFITKISGGIEPYRVELQPMFQSANTTLAGSTAYVYQNPGEYTAKAWVTDSTGMRAESNVVVITVLKSDRQMWNIIVTPGFGGRVTPGSTQVADGADSPLFLIAADSGYVVDYVLIDGQNKGALNEYQFKAVDRNHALDAFFRNTVTGKYTINSSAGTGLAINPSGSHQYDAGANADYTISVVDADYAIDQVLVDGSPVAVSPPAPYVYHFSNIQANHTINATSKRVRYTINASAGANGSIDPIGAVKVNSGASQSFTITANTGYAIESVLVDGSPVTFSPSPFVYTFPNVSSDHTISASFKVATFTITVDHSFKGHTVPGTGIYTVNYGGSFTIQNIADTNCAIDYINVDGNGVPNSPTYTFSNVTANHTYYCAFRDNPPPPNKWKVYVEEQYILNGNPAGYGYWDSTYDEGSWADIYFYHEHPIKAGYFLTRVLVDNVDKPLDGSGGYRFSVQMFQNHEVKVVYEKVEL